MTFLGAGLAAVLALAQGAPASTPPVSDGPNTVDPVVVTGHRETEEEQRRRASAFVRGLAAPTQRGRLARWDRGVCPGVVGLSEKQATYIADRIAIEAQALKLEVGRPGCRPDILILFTRDPNKVASDFRDQHPAYFAADYRRDRLTTGGGDQSLTTFLTQDRPVRWWHVAELATSDGQPVFYVRGAPASLNGVSSRLASAWKEDLSRALIIVDTTRMNGISHEQLASYLAMVSLAQLNPEAKPSELPTIMSLFDDRDAGRAPPEGMTAQDRAYLKGLYDAPLTVKNLNAHRGAIRRSLMKAR